jgi:hypothetical protein
MVYIVHGGFPIMANKRVFVEQRPQGDFAVRKPNSERASAVRPTQAEAIERARELNPGTPPLVERVRHTSVGKPDQWRKP